MRARALHSVSREGRVVNDRYCDATCVFCALSISFYQFLPILGFLCSFLFSLFTFGLARDRNAVFLPPISPTSHARVSAPRAGYPLSDDINTASHTAYFIFVFLSVSFNLSQIIRHTAHIKISGIIDISSLIYQIYKGILFSKHVILHSC